MNFISKKHLSRRTMLRGLGVSVGLPLLDSMVAAQTPLARTAATSKSRLSCIYVPHGATMDKWTPDAEGKSFAFTEILSPLEKYRDRLTIVSNLAHPAAGGLGSDAGADHARSAAVFLSGVHPEKDSIRVGPTIDQIAAKQIGQDTPLPSLELSIEEVALSCGSGYACAYSNTISWEDATTPLPMENNPQVVFEKLFGDGSTNADRIALKAQNRSLLDSVMGQVASLQKDLPAQDRGKLSDYLDDVREIERRIQKSQQHASSELKLPESPVGIPESFDEHFKIMFDLQVLAFRTEMTRVATMMYARDTSGAVYPQSGVRDGFHVASHHGNARANMDKYALINKYHVQMLAYFLGKLQGTPDGDGNLLDHSMILYGSSMSNGNQHDHDPLPLVLAGGASGKLDGGRHLKFAPHTPASNLLLSVLDKLGIQQAKHGDSTGKLNI
ncbi:MAG TPA: DUF1552 domain-containing protein [Bryobacteraceae bacterium]|jgi:hypothetical protein|nr:DUF1552 domain-containing protein [Bryobacteraceae bacterium]